MNQVSKKNDILERALGAFHQATGIAVHTGIRHNAEVVFDFPGGLAKYSTEIKPHLTRHNVGTILLRHTHLSKAYVLVTDFVNSVLAQELRNQNICFVDAAGNAFVRNNKSFVFVKGNRPNQTSVKDRIPRLFKRTGLQVIYTLLVDSDAESATYRELAKITNVATGSVGWIFYDLKHLGYIVETSGTHRRLKKRKELFEKWISAYPEHLRPALSIGRFRTIDRKPIEEFKKTNLERIHGKWGGEIAAEHLTGYLKPATASIFTPHNLTEVVRELRLVPDREGPIEVLRMFWGGTVESNQNINVHPLLVYADLVTSGDARNLEAAKLIYDKYLKSNIEAD